MKALVVLARLPFTAKVKPRLAAEITTRLAAQFYRACAEHTLVESARCEGVVRYLFYSDGSREQAEEWMTSIHQEALQLQPQATWTDCGGRTRDAFQTVFAAGASMVVWITSDVPDMDASIISSAFAALESSDVVFGPTHDGGYYLIGLKSYQPSLFEVRNPSRSLLSYTFDTTVLKPTSRFLERLGPGRNLAVHETEKTALKGIPWGTDKVLDTSISKAESLGLTVAPLASDPLLYDIDTLDSLVHWMELPSSKANPHYGLSVKIVEEHDYLVEALSETGYLLEAP